MKGYLLVSLVFCAIFKGHCLELLDQWNLLKFNYPPNYDTSNFRLENTVPTGIEITDDRIFIGTPRIRSGVPATLSWIPRNAPKGSSPVLQAYPDWSFHTAGLKNYSCAGLKNYSCAGLISVYRMRLDSCNRLWVLDAGTVDSLETYMRPCDPKIVIFDLKTDTIVRSIIFPTEVQRPVSVMTNLIIDESVQGQCDSAFVYMSDSVAPAIVVFDALNDKIWRFSDPPMYPNPDFANMNIQGEQFTLLDGIIGLAHSPQLATLFFQPMATDKIFSVPTAALRRGPPGEFDSLPITTAGRKSSPGLGLTTDENDNTLYFSPVTETSIATWNPTSNVQKVLATDPVQLQFVADMVWKNDGTVYILSSRFQKYVKRTVNPSEMNVRILQIPTRTYYSRPRVSYKNPFPYYFK